MIDLECWCAGGNDLYLYTENRDFARELKKEFGAGAIYERYGKVFAWQFKVPNRTIAVLKRRFDSLRRSSEQEEPENLLVESQ
jgi:hypothetical protein